ncbi:MAG TPA: protein-disulfide reductase DsbD domain-containing protein [Blastocatellia bacterium]|nr:protein-disulfide reductase DsbD domain-containing protein [Blastocatellia bacterium]
MKETFFEAAFTNRYTPNNLITKLFPELTEQAERNIDAPHISLKLQQSDRIGVPGSRVTLIAELTLGRGLHVYAPGVKGYVPIELDLDPTPDLKPAQSVYPKERVLFLPAIKERVPVFEGRFRITQDVTLSVDRPLVTSKLISIKGTLKYQACDNKVCYVPTSVPVSWEIQVIPLNTQRSPEQIRHH